MDLDARSHFIRTGKFSAGKFTAGKFSAGSGRLVELDAMRGLAILFVVVYHLSTSNAGGSQSEVLSAISRVFSIGWMGVDLFFVLSGFLIGTILLEYSRAPNFFVAFYARRCARLLPLYLVVLVAYAVARPVLSAQMTDAGSWLIHGEDQALPLWSYIFYLQNVFVATSGGWGGHWLAPTWSLAIEEQFYLVAPLLVIWLPAHRRLAWFVGLAVCAMLLRTWLFVAAGHAGPGFLLLPGRADALFIGMAGAAICTDASMRTWLSRNTRLMTAGLWASAAVLIAVLVANVGVQSFVMASIGHSLLAIMSLNLIFAALFADVWFCRVMLRNRILIELGGLSYAIYLLHQPMRGLVWLATTGATPDFASYGDLPRAVVVIGLTIAAARLSRVWLEQPMLALGHRVKYRQVASALTGTSPQADRV